MNDVFDPNRRRFLLALAFTIANSAIHIPGLDEPHYITWDPDDVDWDEVISEVIGNRNRRLSGFQPTPAEFPIGSPWWCMEQAMSELIGDGGSHVG